jgi:hypothetical protein
MKVEKLLKELEEYKNDEEIIVLYFDKVAVTDYLEQEITPEQWAKTVEKVESIPMAEIHEIFDTITEQAEEVLREERTSNA